MLLLGQHVHCVEMKIDFQVHLYSVDLRFYTAGIQQVFVLLPSVAQRSCVYSKSAPSTCFTPIHFILPGIEIHNTEHVTHEKLKINY